MIFDSWTHFPCYFSLHSRFEEVFRFCERTPLETLPKGTHEIDGRHLFVVVDEYTTKPQSDCLFEAHRRYIDIQILLKGTERIGVAPLALVSTTPYQSERDLTLATGASDLLTLTAGYFTIFFPRDAHQPGIMSPTGSTLVKKAVVKVEVV